MCCAGQNITLIEGFSHKKSWKNTLRFPNYTEFSSVQTPFLMCLWASFVSVLLTCMNTWWLLTFPHNFRSNQGECLEPVYFQIFLCFGLFVWKQRKLEPKIILLFGLKNTAVLYNGADGERQGLLLRISAPFHKSCEHTVTPSSCLCLAELYGCKRAWSLDCLQDALCTLSSSL